MSAFSLRMYLLEGKNLFYSHIFPVGPSPKKFLNKTYPAIGSTHLFYQAANHSPIYSPVYPSIHKSNHPCIFWYIQTSIHPSAYSCIHIHSPMHTSTYHIFIYPFIYPPINLSIHQHHTHTNTPSFIYISQHIIYCFIFQNANLTFDVTGNHKC